MSIVCLKYRPVNKGNVLGYFDILLQKQHLEIYDCVLLQKDGKRWVSMPTKKFKNEKGEDKYSTIVRIHEKELQQTFIDAVKDAVDEFLKKNPVMTVNQNYCDRSHESV